MKNRVSWVLVAVLLPALIAGGCGTVNHDEDGEEGEGASRADSSCAVGIRWAGGNEESPNMRPGMACNDCHRREREGPIYGAAGTVFPNFSEADDCYGTEGITVEITDATGHVHTATTRVSGNFYFREPIVTPYTARVIDADGGSRPMATAQMETDCNTCHTANGLDDAPGRIMIP